MIFVIGGVTASGKSDLAFRFAKAINGIIINADAFAFYKELNIGTAKPTKEELAMVPTFLFNNISLDERFSIYNYQKEVRVILDEYLAKKVPIVLVGGSGLYIRAALYNYNLQPEKELKIVDDHKISNTSLHKELEALDKEAASKIHPNNRKRVLRALALIKTHAQTKTALEEVTTSEPLYPYTMICLDKENEVLHRDIETRVKLMFAKGLRMEAVTLSKKYPRNAQGMQAIGYKEIVQNPNATDEELMNLIALRTRQYAKRQRTFFRNQFTATWFTDKEEAFNYLRGKYEELL
ncbi:MAG TPA: tRNA (adenosine(37)-N6)-dimethylallyltransferase MiaA [Bacilli bacterium]|nr:tRNA (adenosine(37)-N6)-dimethylallyltransferase MiaA [Bacilli bacterium]